MALFLRLALVVGLVVLSGASSALAEARLALVIGNSSYRSVTPLPNPMNDAKAVADQLKAMAFDVTAATDLNQADMRRAIRDFAAKIAEKGPETVALVFYAGHGVQVEGENFLVPVDAHIQREADIPIEALRLADLMNALAGVPSKVRIVILDACRNNPFSPGKQTRGLAIVDAPTGSIVAYSTAPGTEATDGAGTNSPYTAALLEVIKQPNLPIEQAFKQVRLKVNQSTRGQQTPWESTSLISDFWFLPYDTAPAAPAVATATSPAPTTVATRQPAPAIPTAPATVPLPVPAPLPKGYASAPPAPSASAEPAVAAAPAAPAIGPASPPPVPVTYASAPVRASRAAEIRMLPPEQAFDLALEEDTIEAYEEFLLLYPSDPHAEWVRVTLARRVDAIAWRYAVVVNTPAAYEAYVARYPGGVYADDAVRLRVRPRIRVIDTVIAPRVIVPPPTLRVALPLVQTRRAPGVQVFTPTLPPRVAPVAFPAANRLPGIAPPAALPRQNAVNTAPALNVPPQNRLPTPNLPAALPRQNAVNAAPAQNIPSQNRLPKVPAAAGPKPNAVSAAPTNNVPLQNRLPPPNAPAAVGPRPNAVTATPNPKLTPAPTGPAANVAPRVQPAAAPPVRPAAAQMRPPPQRAQLAPRPVPQKCAGKSCKR